MAVDKQLLIKWRRHFHMYPELSGEERETAAEAARLLKSFGLQVSEGIGGHGLVALLPGAGDYKCAALRADIGRPAHSGPSGCGWRSRQAGSDACLRP